MLVGPSFIDYWFVDYVFSFRAARGELDAHAPLFQTMLFSLQVNPQWFAKVVNTKEYLAQMAIRGIQAVGRAGEIAARAGSDLRAEQQADWERRQAAQDRAAENFTDYVRGVERFTDPHAGTEVELPAGLRLRLGQRPRRVRHHGESELQPEHRVEPALGADAACAVSGIRVGVGAAGRVALLAPWTAPALIRLEGVWRFTVRQG